MRITNKSFSRYNQCMLPDLKEIKYRRKRFSLTQSDLARLTGVSQSLVAKIESEQTIPSYENAKKIFDNLERLENEHVVKAEDIMTRKIVSVKKKTNVKKAISLMGKNSISQLPVIEESQCVGNVNEKTLLEKFDSFENISGMDAGDVMGEALPTVSGNTPITLIQQMLGYSSAVLVAEKGKIRGIISKSDLLEAVAKRKD